MAVMYVFVTYLTITYFPYLEFKHCRSGQGLDEIAFGRDSTFKADK